MKDLRTLLLLLLFLFTTNLIFSQVGVNTENPAVTLDVSASSTSASTAEGFLSPRLTGSELAAKNAVYGLSQNAAIVYVTSADPSATAKTKFVTSPGYYYYDATADNGAGSNSGIWTPLKGRRDQFYMPSVVLPTNSTSLPDAVNYAYASGTYTVNLFGIYKNQYGNPQVKSMSSAFLNVGVLASSFDYFVLYYDDSVFSSVTVSASGQLSYSIIPDAIVTEKTFMNIMLRER